MVSLDKAGDAIREIYDTHRSRTVELLVSTKVLCLASLVFAAMFEPYFAEGQKKAAREPVRVKLEDDDARAMKTILRALHYHPIGELEPSNAKELACLAIHCDKYDCRASLKSWIYCWFSLLEPRSEEPEHLSFLLLAAYKFTEPKQFANISALIVNKMPPEFPATSYDHEMFSLLPETVTGMFE